MYYTTFIIKNFRGIDKVELDLSHNRILTLVGLNESGKSTILTAINTFYKLVKNDDLSESEINTFRPKGIAFNGEIEIEAQLKFEPQDNIKLHDYYKTKGTGKELLLPDIFSYTFKFEFNLSKYAKTNRTCGFSVKEKETKSSLNETEKDSWNELIRFIKSDLVPEVLFYEDFIFDIPDKIAFSKTNEAIDDPSGKNTQWQLVLSDILKAVNPGFTSFQESIVNIWDTDNDLASNRISSMEGVLNQKITAGWKELFKETGKRGGKQRLNFKEIKLAAITDGNNLHISFKVKTDSNKEFLINERSKGCKWFFSFLLFTEFRKNRTKNILFLLDEPASNLHSSAQMKIMDAIEELSNGSIVIYSTHSHHLINPKWLSGAYVIINEMISDKQLIGEMTFDEGAKISAEKYFSYIGRGKGSVKTSYFQPILDRLDYLPSYVEPIPNIIITEGKNDWYTFKYFAEIILEDKHNYHFYPGAGRNQLWDIIRLYLAWGKKFKIILDGDEPSIKAKNDYIKEFQDFLMNRIFTLNDIFGKQIETEDLISSGDKEKICDEVYGTGKYKEIKDDADKLKLSVNTAINQLLIKNKKLSLSKQTKENFKKLLKFLKN